MKCLEAQSYIMPFINEKIPEAKQEEFVMHMKACPKCHEELEIYYILLKGMDQLNNEKKLSTDFNRDLEMELKSLVSKSKGRKTAKISAFSIVITAMIFFMAIFYGDCISRVYAFEQDTKLASQGNYYFAEKLGSDLFVKDKDRIRDERQKAIDTKEEITFFNRIEAFHLLKENADFILRDMENHYCGKVITYRWK